MGFFVGTIPTPPRVLSELEQKRLLDITGERRGGFRDHLLLSLALATGLRVHELVALDVGDVFDEAGRARRRVALKVFKGIELGDVEQEALLSEVARAKLTKFRAWKAQEGESLDADAPLFVSKKGNRLSTRQARYLFKVWQQRAGIERLYTFHSLRHSAITNVYQRTKDIRLTQRFARHASITSTQRYAHASLEDLIRAVQDLPC